MNSEKNKLLKDTYDKFIEISLKDIPMDGIEEFIDQNIMGYGTAIDEKILSLSDYRELILRQKEQGKDIEMKFDISPVLRRIAANSNSAVFIDEIKITMLINNETHQLFVRLSTVLEFEDQKWIVVHWHGSKPENIEGATDTWHINEGQQKNAELEKLVEEKTADLLLKNRELEIEAALERVRAIALSMKEPADMLDVCRVISDHLKQLNVTDIRNVQTAIVNESKGTYLNYQYFTAYDKTIIEETEYDKHPTVLQMVKEMRKSADAYFSGSLESEQLNIFREYRKKDNQFPDPLLDEADVVNYYFYSIGQGGLGLTTYKPLLELNLNIFKRFHNVFKLAYRRFIDIEQAEAQAREAQIEAALERVRSRTIAMQNSNELSETAYLLFQQFGLLDVSPEQLTIGIMDETQRAINLWETLGGNQMDCMLKTPIDEPVVINKVYVAWKERKKSLVIDISGDEIKEYYNFFKNIPEYKEFYDFKSTHIEHRRVVHTAFFSKGLLSLATPEPIPLENIQLLERFASVFEQTYTRFLDLQKAEARAREAQIEAALEKIRNRTLLMKDSSELNEAVAVFFQQFKLLELLPTEARTYFSHVNTSTDTVEVWMTHADGRVMSGSHLTPMTQSPQLKKYYNEWKKNKEFINVRVYREQDLKDYMSFLSTLPHVAKDEDYQKLFNTPPDQIVMTDAGFLQGFLGIMSYEPLKQEAIDILSRFAKAFEFTYTRFLDLQKAEAQARESQIEAALEKIRSRSLAMHKTEELQEVVAVVAAKLQELGMVVDASGVIICTYFPDSKDVLHWISSPDFSHSAPYLLPYFEHPIFVDTWESKNSGTDFFSKSWKFEVKNSFYEYAFEHSDYKYFPNEGKEWVLASKHHALSFAWSKNSAILLPSYTGILPSEQDKEILKRFARVFEQAYIRFMDLQKAEAQAREAKIEAALERVRAKAMAMHSSDDLALTVDVFFKELKNLEVTPRRYGVTLINEKTRIADLTLTTATEQGEDLKMTAKLTLGGHPVLDKVYNNWKQQQEYHPVLKGSEIKNYYQSMNPEIAYPDFPDAIQYGHYFFFEEGGVFAWTEKELSEEDLNIFRRFTSVLSLTYRRYMDLKNAEAQNLIIQAENERKTKELEEARMLQLAMLPKELPKHPNLEIAVYMKTATEVGGDYYDFCFSDNGSLNLCLGDATGHGMKAGIMVSSMKSIFTTNAPKMNIEQFFITANSGVKSMNLKRMMMGFIMLNLNQNKFKMINAGLPPIFQFCNKSGSVEEIKEHGVPIGAMNHSKYIVTDLMLDKGDVILLLTDGMPELQNENHEMYGYERIRDGFKKVAKKTPEEIISFLKDESSAWLNGKELEDDVTFVVIKA